VSGKWHWHPLAIDWCMDWSTSKREKEGNLRSVDCLLEKQEAKTEEPNEKGKRQVAMTATCD